MRKKEEVKEETKACKKVRVEPAAGLFWGRPYIQILHTYIHTYTHREAFLVMVKRDALFTMEI